MVSERVEPRVVVRGEVDDDVVTYAQEKMLRFLAKVDRPVLDLEIRLDRDADPARPCPCHADVAIDLDGVPLHGHSEAPAMRPAIDRAVERLERRVRETIDRTRSRAARHRDPSSWHHGDSDLAR